MLAFERKFFHQAGRKLMLFQFIRKVIAKTYQITGYFFLFQFLVKCSKDLLAICQVSVFLYLLFLKQPSFTPGDSCINQLIAITHEIQEGFNDALECGEYFLISVKHLTKRGTKVLPINCNVMVFLVIY